MYSSFLLEASQVRLSDVERIATSESVKSLLRDVEMVFDRTDITGEAKKDEKRRLEAVRYYRN